MTATNTIGMKAAAQITVPRIIKPEIGDIVRIGIPGSDPIDATIRQICTGQQNIISAEIDKAQIDAIGSRIGAGIDGIIDINGIRINAKITLGSQETAANVAIVAVATVMEIAA